MKGFTTKFQSFHATDEWYTPRKAVEIIVPYVSKKSTIWCPFDKESSEFVQVFRGGGHKVICSHIDDGKDFFLYEPDEYYDCIISNPPYSKKDSVYKRLFQLGKPWGMLVGMNGLFDNKTRFGLFSHYGCQILVPNGRTKFINKENNEFTSPPFQTIYVCWNLLPETIMFQQDETGLFEEAK